MKKSTVSVVIPNYNHAHYLPETLEAILSQSRRPDEVIVVDDGSTDNSVEVIEEFARRDPIVRLIRNQENRGVMFSSNLALVESKGNYVYFAASDDRVLPGFFEKSLNCLEDQPRAGLCCSYPISFSGENRIFNPVPPTWNRTPCYLPPHKLAVAIHGSYIAGHTSIVKRSSSLQAGGYLTQLKWHCDWFHALSIAFRHGICYIPEPLAMIRVLPQSYSAAGRKRQDEQKQVLCCILDLLQSEEYRDVLPFFQRSGVMAHFGTGILRVVLGHSKYRNAECFKLIRRVPYLLLRWRLGRASPAPVTRIYRRLKALR